PRWYFQALRERLGVGASDLAGGVVDELPGCVGAKGCGHTFEPAQIQALTAEPDVAFATDVDGTLLRLAHDIVEQPLNVALSLLEDRTKRLRDAIADHRHTPPGRGGADLAIDIAGWLLGNLDGALHLVVTAAAKDVAVEGELAYPVRRELHPGDRPGIDLRLQIEPRAVEAVPSVERRQLQNRGHTPLQHDHAGRILELLRRHLHHLLRR